MPSHHFGEIVEASCISAYQIQFSRQQVNARKV